MVDTEQAWPADLPSNCPPDEAVGADLIVYRFVKSDPPSREDFLRPIDKPRKSAPAPSELCSLYALSVFAEKSDVLIAQEFIPGMKKKRVAMGQITPPDGVVENSPTSSSGSPSMNSHYDWWVADGFDARSSFVVVDV